MDSFINKQSASHSTIDYYPFGMEMPGRMNPSSGSTYRFGMNGQMKDNEFTGQDGAHTTAMFWEYDSRIGRRWNLDPKPQVNISDYACFGNNPMINIDPDGDYFFGLFGSTKAQREAATQLAKSTCGTIVFRHQKNIMVTYTRQVANNPKTGEPVNQIYNQYFNKDGSLVPLEGEYKETSGFKQAEMWLETSSGNAAEAGAKIAVNMLYSLPNSVKILLEGSTLAGSDGTERKVDAFVDVAPSLMSLMIAGVSLKVTKSGLQALNQFIKKSPGILQGRGADRLKDAAKLLKSNMNVLRSKEALNSVDEIKEAAEKTNDEIKKSEK